MADKNTKTETKHNKNESKSTAPSTTAETGGSTAPSSALDASRQKRAAEMSIAGKADAKKAANKEDKPKAPSFEVNEKGRAELLGLSDAALLERAKERMRAVDSSNSDVYEPTGNTQDQLNGQEVSRSSVRSAVLHFLNSRPNKQAPVNVIVAYMLLASGIAYKGKFDFGYLTTKDGGEGKRGMVARKLIRRVEQAKTEETAEA